MADALEGLSAIAAARGELERAGLMSGAAEALRKRLGFYEVPAFVFHERYLDMVRQQDPDAFARAQDRGRELTVAEAIALATPDRGAPVESTPLPATQTTTGPGVALAPVVRQRSQRAPPEHRGREGSISTCPVVRSERLAGDAVSV